MGCGNTKTAYTESKASERYATGGSESENAKKEPEYFQTGYLISQESKSIDRRRKLKRSISMKKATVNPSGDTAAPVGNDINDKETLANTLANTLTTPNSVPLSRKSAMNCKTSPRVPPTKNSPNEEPDTYDWTTAKWAVVVGTYEVEQKSYDCYSNEKVLRSRLKKEKYVQYAQEYRPATSAVDSEVLNGTPRNGTANGHAMSPRNERCNGSNIFQMSPGKDPYNKSELSARTDKFNVSDKSPRKDRSKGSEMSLNDKLNELNVSPRKDRGKGSDISSRIDQINGPEMPKMSPGKDVFNANSTEKWHVPGHVPGHVPDCPSWDDRSETPNSIYEDSGSSSESLTDSDMDSELRSHEAIRRWRPKGADPRSLLSRSAPYTNRTQTLQVKQ